MTLQTRRKERTEIDKLEAELAETEYSQVMFNENSSSHHSHILPGVAFRITYITWSLTTPSTVAQVYAFPTKNTQVDTLPSVSTQAYTLPAVSTQAYTLPSASTQAYTLPVLSTQAHTFPALSTQSYTLSALSTQAFTLPAVSSLPPVSTQVYTYLVVSNQVTEFPAAFHHVGASQPTPNQVSLFSASFLQVPRSVEAFLHVS